MKKIFQAVTSDEFDGNYDANTLIVMVVTKNEVLKSGPGDLVDRLMKLSDSKESYNVNCGNLVITFDGWNDDPRELYEIKEVVDFFKMVNAQWSYWYYFCEKFGPTISVVTSLLCPTERISHKDGPRIVIKDENSLKQTILQLFNSMNRLCEMYGESEEKIMKISSEVTQALLPKNK